MALIYDPKDKVSYCSVPKVASSTWCWHFIQLTNMTQEDISKRHQVLQTFAPHVWPAPADPQDFQDAWGNTTSIVIVRHPLARYTRPQYMISSVNIVIDWCLVIIKSLSSLPSMELGLQRLNWSLRNTENIQILGIKYILLLKNSSDIFLID